jgi:hypothetical protein
MGKSGGYFQDFDRSISENFFKMKFFKDIEADLQRLDTAAWKILKQKVQLYLGKKDCERGWVQMFDALNEAKGYAYLASLKCQNIKFIPESPTNGPQTPDLEATLGGEVVLCEVKTIDISEIEVEKRQKKNSIRDPQTELVPQFFNKLFDTITLAKAQMDAYLPDNTTRKIAYLFLDFDDLLNEFALSHYQDQLMEYKESNHHSETEIVFEFHPPCYPNVREQNSGRIRI